MFQKCLIDLIHRTSIRDFKLIVTLVFDIFYMTSDTGTYTSRYLRCCNTYQIIADSFTLSCRNRDACKWHKQAVCTHYLKKLRFMHIHRIDPVIIDDWTKSRTGKCDLCMWIFSL